MNKLRVPQLVLYPRPWSHTSEASSPSPHPSFSRRLPTRLRVRGEEWGTRHPTPRQSMSSIFFFPPTRVSSGLRRRRCLSQKAFNSPLGLLSWCDLEKGPVPRSSPLPFTNARFFLQPLPESPLFSFFRLRIDPLTILLLIFSLSRLFFSDQLSLFPHTPKSLCKEHSFFGLLRTVGPSRFSPLAPFPPSPALVSLFPVLAFQSFPLESGPLV